MVGPLGRSEGWLWLAGPLSFSFNACSICLPFLSATKEALTDTIPLTPREYLLLHKIHREFPPQKKISAPIIVLMLLDTHMFSHLSLSFSLMGLVCLELKVV